MARVEPSKPWTLLGILSTAGEVHKYARHVAMLKDQLEQMNKAHKEALRAKKAETSALQEQLRKKEEELDFTRKALADKEAELVNTLRGHNADLQSGFNMRVGTVDYLTQELEGKGLQLAAKDEEIGLLRGRIAELEAAAVQDSNKEQVIADLRTERDSLHSRVIELQAASAAQEEVNLTGAVYNQTLAKMESDAADMRSRMVKLETTTAQAIASEAEAKQEYQRLSITMQASMAACWEHGLRKQLEELQAANEHLAQASPSGGVITHEAHVKKVAEVANQATMCVLTALEALNEPAGAAAAPEQQPATAPGTPAGARVVAPMEAVRAALRRLYGDLSKELMALEAPDGAPLLLPSPTKRRGLTAAGGGGDKAGGPADQGQELPVNLELADSVIDRDYKKSTAAVVSLVMTGRACGSPREAAPGSPAAAAGGSPLKAAAAAAAAAAKSPDRGSRPSSPIVRVQRAFGFGKAMLD